MELRAVVGITDAEMGPYSGMPIVAAVKPPPLRRSRVPPPTPLEAKNSQVIKKAELNEKISPRTEDIMALHDLQVARLDQTFYNYPLWMIQKVLLSIYGHYFS